MICSVVLLQVLFENKSNVLCDADDIFKISQKVSPCLNIIEFSHPKNKESKMSLLKVCLTVAVIASIVIDQANARPRAEDIMKNTIRKKSEYREELDGNNTEKRGKGSVRVHPTDDQPKNSELTKAIDK